jgi:hypothetical protein
VQSAMQDMLRVTVTTLPQEVQVVVLALKAESGDDEEQG